MDKRAIRIIHYLNQFFGGIGGEDKADLGLHVHERPVGPGIGLQKELGERGQIVATFICGDNYFNLELGAARAAVLEAARAYRPDVVVAGPAFNAGRYGVACGEVCKSLSEGLGVPAVTAMYPENPGVGIYRGVPNTWILPTGELAAGMPKVLPNLAAFAWKLGTGQHIGPAKSEGYIPTGRRVLEFAAVAGANRAITMLLAKLKGEPFQTEVSIEQFERVPAAPPVRDLGHARVAVLTTAGLVPKGNPDGFRMFNATGWSKYPLPAGPELRPGDWEVIHGGFNTSFAQANPNLVLPLDALRELAGQVYEQLDDHFYSMTGVGTSLSVARRAGEEIAASMRQSQIDAALLVAT
jgi:glycine reductase complex component B subunit gamma